MSWNGASSQGVSADVTESDILVRKLFSWHYFQIKQHEHTLSHDCYKVTTHTLNSVKSQVN